jgi:hypothetical protein
MMYCYSVFFISIESQAVSEQLIRNIMYTHTIYIYVVFILH